MKYVDASQCPPDAGTEHVVGPQRGAREGHPGGGPLLGGAQRLLHPPLYPPSSPPCLHSLSLIWGPIRCDLCVGVLGCVGVGGCVMMIDVSVCEACMPASCQL